MQKRIACKNDAILDFVTNSFVFEGITREPSAAMDDISVRYVTVTGEEANVKLFEYFVCGMNKGWCVAISAIRKIANDMS